MNQPLLQMDLRLVVGAVLVLAAAVIAIWMIGRRMRADMGLVRAEGGATPAASVPSQVARELQARGLATPAQLASMTETERQLLFSTAAGAISRAADDDTRLAGVGSRAVVSPDELPVLFCPLCGYRVERFTSTPPITGQCETCGTKVIVRRDGARLLLTVVPPSDRPELRT